MIRIKNILLTTDFSKISLAAAPYAIELAQKYGAKIHLMHVQEKEPPILAIRSLDVSEEKIAKMLSEEASASMKKTAEQITGKGFTDIATVIKKGIDYQEIVNYCSMVPIDLVVIATHGRTGILHTLLGSVAEKVIRYCKCPVLVITPEDHSRT